MPLCNPIDLYLVVILMQKTFGESWSKIFTNVDHSSPDYNNNELLCYLSIIWNYDNNSYVILLNSYAIEKPGALRIRIEVIKFSNFKFRRKPNSHFVIFSMVWLWNTP